MAWRDMYGQAIGGRGRSASMAASHEQGGETLSRESIGVLPVSSPALPESSFRQRRGVVSRPRVCER